MVDRIVSWHRGGFHVQNPILAREVLNFGVENIATDDKAFTVRVGRKEYEVVVQRRGQTGGLVVLVGPKAANAGVVAFPLSRLFEDRPITRSERPLREAARIVTRGRGLAGVAGRRGCSCR